MKMMFGLSAVALAEVDAARADIAAKTSTAKQVIRFMILIIIPLLSE